MVKNDPERVIFNFSKNVPDIKTKLLLKGLNFCSPPEQLNFANYFVHFSFCYRDICYLGIYGGLRFGKTKK